MESGDLEPSRSLRVLHHPVNIYTDVWNICCETETHVGARILLQSQPYLQVQAAADLFFVCEEYDLVLVY